MTVTELISELQKMPWKGRVILQEDPEGNGHRELEGVGLVLEHNEEYYNPEWTADEADMDDEEWEELKSTSDLLVVLWPR